MLNNMKSSTNNSILMQKALSAKYSHHTDVLFNYYNCLEKRGHTSQRMGGMHGCSFVQLMECASELKWNTCHPKHLPLARVLIS